MKHLLTLVVLSTFAVACNGGFDSAKAEKDPKAKGDAISLEEMQKSGGFQQDSKQLIEIEGNTLTRHTVHATGPQQELVRIVQVYEFENVGNLVQLKKRISSSSCSAQSMPDLTGTSLSFARYGNDTYDLNLESADTSNNVRPGRVQGFARASNDSKTQMKSIPECNDQASSARSSSALPVSPADSAIADE